MFVVDTNVLVYAADADSRSTPAAGSGWNSGGGSPEPGTDGDPQSSCASRRTRA
jgi:hypothetical protein